MTWLFDTIKGRVVGTLVVFLSLSHLIGLWLYVQKSDEATTLLHDALVAEQIALITRLAERLPAAERGRMLDALSGPTVRIMETRSTALGEAPGEGSRAHAFEHFLGVFLDRPTHEGMRLAYSAGDAAMGNKNLLRTVQGPRYSQADHLPAKPLADIKPTGNVVAEIALSDKSWLRFSAPLLTVTPLSSWKVGPPLLAMLVSVLLIAAWVLHRWTQPLTQLAAAAERFGTDVHAPPLAESGPSEVRMAAHTFNRMQERIRRLLEDRTAFAAAIAHDLGTPITRLTLRAQDIGDESARSRVLADLEQMRRMITATLEFARLEFAAETSETIDLASLVQSLCDDLSDAGQDVSVDAIERATICSKPTSLRRALANVLDNAVKYGKRARVEVTSGAQEVRILVKDEGPGVADDRAEEAFLPFRRLTPADGSVEGTGLGLSIARSIVRGLGGEIALTNRCRGGLCVTVTLPRTGAAPAGRTESHHRAPGVRETHSTPRNVPHERRES